LLSSIKKVLPSACVRYSFEHEVDDGLPSVSKKALSFMSKESVKDKTLEEVAPLFIEHCQLSSEQVQQVETSTRGQHTNKMWFGQRSSRITASKFQANLYIL
jgi:hypothetical protein